MAQLRNLADGHNLLLEPEHLVGRSALCALRIDAGYVSAQHAIFRWTGKNWELKDLGSRNGTFLDGARIPSREPSPLAPGAKIAFGQTDQQWELTTDEPPQAMVIPLDGGEPLAIEHDLLPLPSADDPQATIFRADDGTWRLERTDEATLELANQSRFEVGHRQFRFSCPMFMARTMSCDHTQDTRSLALVFSVSHDEEYVHVRAEAGDLRLDLGSRIHNYLLLTLARHRLSDSVRDLPETSRGWIYQDDLAHELGVPLPQLNIDVYRIRKHFAAAGLLNASDIVERRSRTHQLRIGVAKLKIVRL